MIRSILFLWYIPFLISLGFIFLGIFEQFLGFNDQFDYGSWLRFNQHIRITNLDNSINHCLLDTVQIFLISLVCSWQAFRLISLMFLVVCWLRCVYLSVVISILFQLSCLFGFFGCLFVFGFSLYTKFLKDKHMIFVFFLSDY